MAKHTSITSFKSQRELTEITKSQGYSGVFLTLLCHDILQSLLSTNRTFKASAGLESAVLDFLLPTIYTISPLIFYMLLKSKNSKKKKKRKKSRDVCFLKKEE